MNVVVNGVDCDFYQHVQPALHSQRLLFVGNFEYGANLEAIEWALEDIMPQVWMSNPAVRLAIAGHALPISWKLHWNDPRIEWFGYRPDLRELQKRSALFFAPLRYAGGSKVKILEAMAAGLPVITTGKGVSGLAANNGEHYLGSDDGDQARPADHPTAQPALAHEPTERCRAAIRPPTPRLERSGPATGERAHAPGPGSARRGPAAGQCLAGPLSQVAR